MATGLCARSRGRHVAAGLVALSTLMGCTGIPRESSPTAIGTDVPGAATAVATAEAPPPPDVSVDPDSPSTPDPQQPSPSSGPPPPLPNPAPSTIVKVIRSGDTRSPSIMASTTSFAEPATYPDGVVVSVNNARAAVELGEGPGVFNGRELLVVDLEITNGSKEPVNVDQVVITTYYGKEKQLAPVVYPGNLQMHDFSGVADAGSKASARYAFAVPKSALPAVTMVVDFDALHGSAVFTGPVKIA